MSAQWKPGDVAMVGREVAIRVAYNGSDFAFVDGLGRHWRNEDETARPLLVIDPEDREQVERLADLLGIGDAYVSHALRSLAQPEDPEPTGLGAVVRDGRGNEWVRVEGEYGHPWFQPGGSDSVSPWSDIPRPLTVLSSGWTEAER